MSTYRKFLLTINNPKDYNLEHAQIKEILSTIENKVSYWCMADEIGDKGTYHTHLFINMKHDYKIRCAAIKKLFPSAHIDACNGKAEEVRNYVLKGTGHEEKQHTQVPDTFEELCDFEEVGKKTFTKAVKDIANGKTVLEVLNEDPTLVKQVSNLKQYKSMIDKQIYSTKIREVEVIYKWGLSGTGKTSSIFAENPNMADIYVVQDYVHPFDAYDGESIIVFEEYRSNFMLTNMLQYLDRYPVQLPARYANHMAAFTKIYVVSNISISEQYLQCDYASRQAFLRRFNKVEFYYDDHIDVASIEYKGAKYEIEYKETRENKYSAWYRNQH